MNSLTQNEMYHEYPASPTRRTANYQTQSLNRQSSRGFDAFGPQNGFYGADENATGYDDPRFNDRMNAAMQANYNNPAGAAMPQAWNNSGYAQNNNLAALGATGRRPGRSGRGALPQNWMGGDAGYGLYMNTQGYGGLPPVRQDSADDEELIPTAIVIKNIPFAVRKENLTELMANLGLPLPYAFNYHFDNGVFRGLAFANFTTAEETQTVIQNLNNYNLDGRRLRVEYKKMLPQAERDRIEREKRERRGQLEEQHRPVPSSTLQPSTSYSSIGGGPDRGSSPLSARSPAVDMNDPLALDYYSEILLFKGDPTRGDVLDFPTTLPPEHRRMIHSIAEQLKLRHHSEGQGNGRFVRISRPTQRNQPHLPGAGLGGRPLHRSATTDFSQARLDGGYGSSREAPPYLGLMPDLHAPASSSRLEASLRGVKSHADLRSHTPSPAYSSASFPANAGNNGGRYEYNNFGQDSPSASRDHLPTPPTTMAAMNDDFLTNGFSSMNINNGHHQQQGSPKRIRPIASWDRQPPGPIGGHRAFSANLEDSNRTRTTAGTARQQPRGPLGGQVSNFQRPQPRNSHRTRGSDELSSPNGVESIVD